MREEAVPENGLHQIGEITAPSRKTFTWLPEAIVGKGTFSWCGAHSDLAIFWNCEYYFAPWIGLWGRGNVPLLYTCVAHGISILLLYFSLMRY